MLQYLLHARLGCLGVQPRLAVHMVCIAQVHLGLWDIFREELTWKQQWFADIHLGVFYL